MDPERAGGAPGRVRRWERGAGALSIVAGGVHAGVTASHFAKWWVYGLFFLFAATAQLLFGLALLTNAINEEDTGPRWAWVKRVLYRLGILGNAFLFVFYIVTRTVGVPPLGPEAGERETVAGIDVVAKLAELGTIVYLFLALRDAKRPVDVAATP